METKATSALDNKLKTTPKKVIVVIVAIIVLLLILCCGCTAIFLTQKYPKNLAYGTAEKVFGNTPENKLSQFFNAIDAKDTSKIDSVWVVGHASYGNDSDSDLKKFQSHKDSMVNDLESIKVKDYSIQSTKYYNTPCCASGTKELDSIDGASYVLYEIKFGNSDKKYMVLLNVSNPSWMFAEMGEQQDLRNWRVLDVFPKGEDSMVNFIFKPI